MKKYIWILIFSFLLINCSSRMSNGVVKASYYEVKTDTMSYVDQARNRKIPIAIFQPRNKKNLNRIPVIFSHGYGENKGGDYLYAYSYLLEFLASKGYFVVSIQHELPTDELLAMTGKLQITRRPNWERGVQNINFILQQMKSDYLILNFEKLVLLGHSNGGDMSVLFVQQYPDLVAKLITMDQRRMEFPLTSQPRIYTLRSNDYPADEGVLPTEEEAKKHKITIQKTNINHSSMDKDANEEERKYITEHIFKYLQD